MLDALTAPDSPPQFYGRFDEILFTTATNPPISHYKVFYHIYAGKDYPAHFQVYLKGTGSSFYQDASFRRIVAQGFITAGEYATDAPDFTAPSGYQEMCIVVNGQEECGFKQVTTEFGINYITEQYVASQATQTDIKTETACVSGTPNIFPLLNPNLQAGAEEAINPAIYNRGITRICATDDPGRGTDTLAGTVDARWVEVGYCGNPKMKCWLDERSVEDTIRNTDIESKVIKDTTQNYVDALKQELGLVENFGALVEEIEGLGEDNIGKIEKINENYGRVFYNHEKGHLTFLRADAYAKLASGAKPEPESVKLEDEDEEEDEPTTEESIEDECSTREECQRVIGQKIIELARAKEKPGMDADVKANNTANSFECLILQIAYTESNIAHCKANATIIAQSHGGDSLYCDGNVKELITGDEFKSLGVMQINKDVHGEKLFFEENVNYAIDLLVRGHRSSEKIYNCYRPIELKGQPVRAGDFQPKTYSGWQIALRSYNGWNSQCLQKEDDGSLKLDSSGNPILMGNPNYVDDVIGYKDNVEALFPAECGS